MEECLEKSGFLFPHQCGNPVAHVCAQCQKPVCEQHTVTDTSNRHLCTTCAKAARAAQPHPGGRDRYYYDSPYFYSNVYYPDYSYDRPHRDPAAGPASVPHDPQDFTDSDQGALGGDFGGGGDFGPEDADASGGGFEDDMGGS